MSMLNAREVCDQLVETLLTAAAPMRPPVDLSTFHEFCQVAEVVLRSDLSSDACLQRSEASRSFRIEINRSLPHVNRRFAWAHEIAHAAECLGSKGKIAGLRTEGCLLGEHWFDYIASNLLVPQKLIWRFVTEYAPSLESVAEVARVFEVPLVCAASRFVEASCCNCMLVLWKVERIDPVRLVPHRVILRGGCSSRVKIPPIELTDSQPVGALTTKSLLKGRTWIDLGGGPDCYYSESMPSRIGRRAGVMSLFVLERDVELLLRRPSRMSTERKVVQQELFWVV